MTENPVRDAAGRVAVARKVRRRAAAAKQRAVEAHKKAMLDDDAATAELYKEVLAAIARGEERIAVARDAGLTPERVRQIEAKATSVAEEDKN